MTATFTTLNAVEMPRAEAPEARVHHPLEGVVDGVARSSFGHIGLDHFSLAPWRDQGGTDTDLAQLLRSHRLHCSDVGVLRIDDPETSLRAASQLARLADAVDARICTAIVLEVPGDETLHTIARCADILADADVRLALEFVPYTPIRTLAEASHVCSRIGWGRCGIQLDSWHFFHGDNSWADLENLPADHIALVQFDDAPEPIGSDPVHESRHRRALPGDGRLDLERFASVVQANGFRGPVSLEVLSADFLALSPEEQARRGFEALSHFWNIDTATNQEQSSP